MVTSTIPRNRRTRERTTVAKWHHYIKGWLCFRGRPFHSEGGEGWKILSGQIIYFQHELDQKIYFQVYQGQTIFFIRNKILKKPKKKRQKKKNKQTKRGGGGSECWFRRVPGPGQDFPWDFFLFLHTTRCCMCMCIYILKYLKELILKGQLGSSPRIIFSNFHTKWCHFRKF